MLDAFTSGLWFVSWWIFNTLCGSLFHEWFWIVVIVSAALVVSCLEFSYHYQSCPGAHQLVGLTQVFLASEVKSQMPPSYLVMCQLQLIQHSSALLHPPPHFHSAPSSFLNQGRRKRKKSSSGGRQVDRREHLPANLPTCRILFGVAKPTFQIQTPPLKRVEKVTRNSLLNEFHEKASWNGWVKRIA